MTNVDSEATQQSEAGGEKPKRKGPSRRLLILGGLAAGGGIAIGAALSPFSRLNEQRAMVGRPGESVLLSSLRIAPDDSITVIYPHADMGTGVGTALAQILADELDADWDNVRIERAPGETAFANGALGQAYVRGDTEIPAPLAGLSWLVTRRLAETMNLQITGGSTAIAMTGMEGMRHAGASARYMLTRAAAKSWGVPVEEVDIKGGRIIRASGKSAGFGEFAEASLEYDPPARLPFKSKSAYTQIGKSRPRFDIPAKVNGEAVYSGDVRLPGMVFAATRKQHKMPDPHIAGGFAKGPELFHSPGKGKVGEVCDIGCSGSAQGRCPGLGRLPVERDGRVARSFADGKTLFGQRPDDAAAGLAGGSDDENGCGVHEKLLAFD